LPSSITLGDYSFGYCTSLASLSLPSDITLGNNDFVSCDALTDIALGTGCTAYELVDSGLYSIDEASKELTLLFYPSGKTGNYTVSDNTVSISDYAFYHSSLTSITIPSTVTSIGLSDYHVFDGASKLTSINVSADNTLFKSTDGILCSINTVDDETTTVLLAYPSGLTATSFTVPDPVDSIGTSAFAETKALTEVNIPKATSQVGQYSFYKCTNLININVADDNETLFDIDGVLGNIFLDVPSLQLYPLGKTSDTYSVPTKFASISPYAFEDCKLNEIFIPSTVEY
jgi:hypothetical protein